MVSTEDHSQSQTFERFYDALASMEAQLISLYEEKMNNSAGEADSSQEIEHLRATVESMEAQLSVLCQELEESKRLHAEELAAACSPEIEAGSEVPLEVSKEVMEELESLRHQVAQFEERRLPEVPPEEGGMINAIKLIKQNLELSNKNEELQAEIDSLRLACQSAQAENQRLSLMTEQQALTVRQELHEELARAKAEVAQVRKRFKEVGAYLVEHFFVDV